MCAVSEEKGGCGKVFQYGMEAADSVFQQRILVLVGRYIHVLR